MTTSIITPAHKTWVIYGTEDGNIDMEPVLFYDAGSMEPVTPSGMLGRSRCVRVLSIVAADTADEAVRALRLLAGNTHGCPSSFRWRVSGGASIQYRHNCTAVAP